MVSMPKKEKSSHSKSLASKQPSENDSIDNKKSETNENKTQMFGTLRVKLRRLAEQMSELQCTIKKPTFEYDLNVQPKFITSNNKLVFFVNEEGFVSIAELGSSLSIRTSFRLNIPNLRAISANKKYLAVSFSNLNEDQINSISKSIKNFNYKAGVALFKINDFNLNFDKVISSSQNYSLVTPSGIGINDNYLYVCDRDLHALYKIELKSGNLARRLITTDQEPTSISLGEKYLVYTDALKLELNLVDMDKLTTLKSVKFSEDLFSEPFDLAYKEGGYVFVKNRADTKIILYDSKLNLKYSFEYDYSNSQGISYFKSSKNEFLLLGYSNSNSKTFKLGLFSDF